MTTDDRPDIEDLYEHEKVAAESLRRLLNEKYGGRTVNEADYVNEARARYAEIGLVAHVYFIDDTTDIPGDMTFFRTPKIDVVGRVDPLREYDHDRQQWEVRKGVFDGKPGLVDPNTGRLKDEGDQRKKDIL